jgi:membrane protein implicated in regulation of membrane protease activity
VKAFFLAAYCLTILAAGFVVAMGVIAAATPAAADRPFWPVAGVLAAGAAHAAVYAALYRIDTEPKP